jgi:type VI secretion system protein ImpC
MPTTQKNKGKPMPVQELREVDDKTLLGELVETFKARDDSARTRSMDLLRTFLEEIVRPGMKVGVGVTRAINERIAAIDSLLSAQLNEILHHEEFQALEGAWRGLRSLVVSTETGENMKIQVLNATKKELLRDFQEASEFTESTLWKKIYESEYGTAGGDPFGALVGDYHFDKRSEDVELLAHISTVAAGAHAPFIGGAGPEMFAMDSFTQMPEPRDLAKIFDKSNPQNTKWLSFRDSEDSRYVALVLPRVLGRLPYGKDGASVDAFEFEEDVDGTDHGKYLWTNASYAYAARLTDAFAKYHWCTAIRGYENGGLVTNLPIHVFRAREGDVGSKCPTEILISDTRDNELAGLGFIALCNYKNTDYAVFFSGDSVQRPKKYDDKDATANADLSRKVPYLMATSRIAHYLKTIARNKIGGFVEKEDCQVFLDRWIKRYVIDQDNVTAEQKAQFPLRDARIEVEKDRARPGCYKARAYLRPHFQLETLGVSLRLVAELPQAKK